MEYISPMVDVVFKKMFSMEENKDMLRGLVKAFLQVDIGNNFQIAGNELPPENPDEKFSRIDLHASSDIGEVDIEVQTSQDSNFVKRFANYSLRMYTSSVKRGDKTYKPRPTLALGILSNTAITRTPKWVTEFMLSETEEHFPLLPELRICFAELSKLKKYETEQLSKSKDARLVWAAFFRSKKEEEFDMLRNNTDYSEVQKAIDVLESFSMDPQVQELARRRENNLIMRQSMLATAKDEGRAEERAKAEAEKAQVIANFRAMGIPEEQIMLAFGNSMPISEDNSDDEGDGEQFES